ncbi:MAG: hypothetical protein PWQ91_405 [Eubacteriales bacterium]|nr:hypothetical protein [Eubacteriales bacterium]MDN5363344.1 hypothetical protein [Eubacteriales bacterium]
MRLSELMGKEVVNLHNGSRLGVAGDSDLLVDPVTGQIQSLIMPARTTPFNFWTEKPALVIPWSAVKKVGSELIIVDLDGTSGDLRRF